MQVRRLEVFFSPCWVWFWLWVIVGYCGFWLCVDVCCSVAERIVVVCDGRWVGDHHHHHHVASSALSVFEKISTVLGVFKLEYWDRSSKFGSFDRVEVICNASLPASRWDFLGGVIKIGWICLTAKEQEKLRKKVNPLQIKSKSRCCL